MYPAERNDIASGSQASSSLLKKQHKKPLSRCLTPSAAINADQ
jgi:hypothetical protein